jgi:hypothetical protein
MVYPKSGTPMVVKDFSFDHVYNHFKALWNEHVIEVPLERIKAVRIIDSLDPQSDYELKVEFAMRDGDNPIMMIKDNACSGQTQFGKIRIRLGEMVSLDLDPDLRRPQTTGPNTDQAPAAVPEQSREDDATAAASDQPQGDNAVDVTQP